MKMKNFLLSLVVLMLLLVSCSKTGNSKDTSKGDSGKEEQIVAWSPDVSPQEKEAILASINSFNEKNKGKAKVTIEFIPRGNGYDYENKLNTAISSGKAPDVVAIDGPTTAAYAHLNILAPIDEYITAEEKAMYVPSIIQQGTYNGKLYDLGAMESSVVLYYNKDMLKKAGIEEPSQDINKAWTWEDVYQAAKKLNKDGVKGINLSWDLGEGQIYGFAPMIWSNGGDLLNPEGTKAEGILNSPENVEALKYLQKFATEGLMSLQTAPDDFGNGKSAMYLMGVWEIANLKKNFPKLNWGLTYYPASPKTKKVVSPSGSWAWGVTATSKHKEFAAGVVKEITGKEGSKRYSMANSMPPSRTDVFAEMKEYDSYPFSIIKEQVTKSAHPRNVSITYPVLSAEFAKATQDIMKGADIKEVLDRSAKKFDQEAERNK